LHVAEALRTEATPPKYVFPIPPPLVELTITHNFGELRERPKGQVGNKKKGAVDNKL